MEQHDKAPSPASGQATPRLKPYTTPTLVSYGALKELTQGGSEVMMEDLGDPIKVNRMA